jgi:hypothetical protein
MLDKILVRKSRIIITLKISVKLNIKLVYTSIYD